MWNCSRAYALLVFLTLAGCQTEGTLLTEHPTNQSNKTAITQINRDIQTTSGLILLAEAELARGNADTCLLYTSDAADE